LSQISLDQAAVYTKLDELKKLVEEQRKTIESLKERVVRIEMNADVSQTGLNEIYRSLEAAGIMKNGEPATTAKPEPTREMWDPQKSVWAIAEGSRGQYERSEDVNNLEFKKMLQDLAVHKGKLGRDGYFYWTFQSGAIVGRKKRGKQT